MDFTIITPSRDDSSRPGDCLEIGAVQQDMTQNDMTFRHWRIDP